MNNINKLIYDEIMKYQENFDNEIISDLDLLYKNNNLIEYLNTRSQLLLNIYSKKNIKKCIEFPFLEKWNGLCNPDCNPDCNPNCIICLDTINNNDDVYNLKCGTKEQLHIYHKTCFEKWNSMCCPYCRTNLVIL